MAFNRRAWSWRSLLFWKKIEKSTYDVFDPTDVRILPTNTPVESTNLPQQQINPIQGLGFSMEPMTLLSSSHLQPVLALRALSSDVQDERRKVHILCNARSRLKIFR